MSRFINDCIARALFTLPWATIDDTSLSLRAIHEDIKSGQAGRVTAALEQFSELVENEVAVHTTCGNYMKAGVLNQFATDLRKQFTSPPERGERGSVIAPTVDTSVYRRSHGAEPRGFGVWAFVFATRTELGPTATLVDSLCDKPGLAWVMTQSLTFGQAKKAALAEAKRRGANVVGVCP